MDATRIVALGLALGAGLTLACTAGGDGGGGDGAVGRPLDGSAGFGGEAGAPDAGETVDGAVPDETPLTDLGDDRERQVCEAQADINIDVIGARDYCEIIVMNVLAATADRRPEPPTAAECERSVAECMETLEEGLAQLLCRDRAIPADLPTGCEQVTVGDFHACVRAQAAQLDAAVGGETCASLQGFDGRFDAALAMERPPECASIEADCPALFETDDELDDGP